MAFRAVPEGPCKSELLGACLDKSKAAIDGQQLGAEAEHRDVNCLASVSAKVVLGGEDQTAGQPGSLKVGGNGEHAHVAVVSAQLGVDRGQHPASRVSGGLGQKDLALPHARCQPVGVGARAFEEGLDGEGGVDHLRQGGNIGGVRQTDVEA